MWNETFTCGIISENTGDLEIWDEDMVSVGTLGYHVQACKDV